MKTTCRWCSKVMPDDIGSYYHAHACEDRVWTVLLRELAELAERGGKLCSIAEVIGWAEQRRERAREVGD